MRVHKLWATMPDLRHIKSILLHERVVCQVFMGGIEISVAQESLLQPAPAQLWLQDLAAKDEGTIISN